MGLDEALLEGVAAGAPPVLRLYGWNPPAVSVGYFQGLQEEVDLPAAKRLGFDVVRRVSGGGAVLHQFELTYSVILASGHPLAGEDIAGSYRILSAGLVAGLRFLGVEAAFSGANDILAGGKKISGNAQTRRSGGVLQHGTVLLDNNPDTMFQVLRVPREKIRDKLIDEVKERVSSLRAILGREVPFEEAGEALERGFQAALGFAYDRAEITEAEDRRARELGDTKFSARDWLFKR
jgi:lipoate-protein ligase A